MKPFFLRAARHRNFVFPRVGRKGQSRTRGPVSGPMSTRAHSEGRERGGRSIFLIAVRGAGLGLRGSRCTRFVTNLLIGATALKSTFAEPVDVSRQSGFDDLILPLDRILPAESLRQNGARRARFVGASTTIFGGWRSGQCMPTVTLFLALWFYARHPGPHMAKNPPYTPGTCCNIGDHRSGKIFPAGSANGGRPSAGFHCC